MSIRKVPSAGGLLSWAHPGSSGEKKSSGAGGFKSNRAGLTASFVGGGGGLTIVSASGHRAGESCERRRDLSVRRRRRCRIQHIPAMHRIKRPEGVNTPAMMAWSVRLSQGFRGVAKGKLKA